METNLLNPVEAFQEACCALALDLAQQQLSAIVTGIESLLDGGVASSGDTLSSLSTSIFSALPSTLSQLPAPTCQWHGITSAVLVTLSDHLAVLQSALEQPREALPDLMMQTLQLEDLVEEWTERLAMLRNEWKQMCAGRSINAPPMVNIQQPEKAVIDWWLEPCSDCDIVRQALEARLRLFHHGLMVVEPDVLALSPPRCAQFGRSKRLHCGKCNGCCDADTDALQTRHATPISSTSGGHDAGRSHSLNSKVGAKIFPDSDSPIVAGSPLSEDATTTDDDTEADQWPVLWQLGLQWAVELLREGRRNDADNVLLVMHLCPDAALHHALLHTTSTQLRDLLASSLTAGSTAQTERGSKCVHGPSVLSELELLALRVLEIRTQLSQSWDYADRTTTHPLLLELHREDLTLHQLLQPSPPMSSPAADGPVFHAAGIATSRSSRRPGDTRDGGEENETSEMLKWTVAQMAVIAEDHLLIRWASRWPEDLWSYLLTSGNTSFLHAWVLSNGYLQHGSGGETSSAADAEVKDGDVSRASETRRRSRESESDESRLCDSMSESSLLLTGELSASLLSGEDAELRNTTGELSRSFLSREGALPHCSSPTPRDASSSAAKPFPVAVSHLPPRGNDTLHGSMSSNDTLLDRAGYEGTARVVPEWLLRLPIPEMAAEICERSSEAPPEEVLNELARHGRFSSATLSSFPALCHRLLRAGLISSTSAHATPPPAACAHSTPHQAAAPTGPQPQPPDGDKQRTVHESPRSSSSQKPEHLGKVERALPAWLRKHSLRLIVTETASAHELMPVMYHWLRLVPPTSEDLETLPQELTGPGSCLARVLALLRAESHLPSMVETRREVCCEEKESATVSQEKWGVVRPSLEAASEGLYSKGTIGSSHVSEGTGLDTGKSSENDAVRDTVSSHLSVNKPHHFSSDSLAELIDEEARFLSRKQGVSVHEWVRVRPWYTLASTLASGRPLQSLSGIIRPLGNEEAGGDESGNTGHRGDVRQSEAGDSGRDCATRSLSSEAGGRRGANDDKPKGDGLQGSNVELYSQSLCSTASSHTGPGADKEVMCDGETPHRVSVAVTPVESLPKYVENMKFLVEKTATDHVPRRDSVESGRFPLGTTPDFESAFMESSLQSMRESAVSFQLSSDICYGSSLDTGRVSFSVTPPTLPVRSTPKSGTSPDLKSRDYVRGPTSAGNAPEPSPGYVPRTSPTFPELRQILSPEMSPVEPPTLTSLLKGRVPAKLLHLTRKLHSLPVDEDLLATSPLAPPIHMYLGYLRQWRPLFAAAHLLSSADFDVVSVHRACVVASQLALRSFPSRAGVAASAVVFQHVLGEDTTPLRAQLVVMRDVPDTSRGELTRAVLSGDTRAASRALDHHETSLLSSLLAAAGGGSASDAAARWQRRAREFAAWRPAVVYCRHHGIPLPERYPRKMAEEDDWMAFMLFMQIFHYPREQALCLSDNFTSPRLREHVCLALCNLLVTRPAAKSVRRRLSSQSQEREMAVGSPDTSRSTSPALSLRRSASPALIVTRGASPALSVSGGPISGSSPGTKLSGLPSESVLAALVAAASDPCPGRALLREAVTRGVPALAALAAQCEDVSAADCLCGWLEAGYPEPPPLEGITVTEESRDRLLRIVTDSVEQRRVRALQRGLQLFFPASPLLHCVALVCCMTSHCEPEEAEARLEELASAMKRSCRQPDSELFPMDRWWLSTAVMSLLLKSLTASLTAEGRARLLGMLIQSRFSATLEPPASSVDLPLLLRLSTILGASGVRLQWLTAMPPSGGAAKLRCEVSRCVVLLCDARELETADKLALAGGVSPDPVVLTQVSDALRAVAPEDRIQFWRQCSARFTQQQLEPQRAVDFFRRHADGALTIAESYACLRLAWDWLPGDRGAELTCDVTSLERAVWTAYTWARIKHETSEEPSCSTTSPPSSLLYRRPLPAAASPSPRIPSSTAAAAAASGANDVTATVRDVIGELLDTGRIRQALLVADSFNTFTQDLDRIVELLQLAEHSTSPRAEESAPPTHSTPRRSPRSGFYPLDGTAPDIVASSLGCLRAGISGGDVTFKPCRANTWSGRVAFATERGRTGGSWSQGTMKLGLRDAHPSPPGVWTQGRGGLEVRDAGPQHSYTVATAAGDCEGEMRNRDTLDKSRVDGEEVVAADVSEAGVDSAEVTASSASAPSSQGHAAGSCTPDDRVRARLSTLGSGVKRGAALAQRVLCCWRACRGLAISYQALVQNPQPLLLLASVLEAPPMSDSDPATVALSIDGAASTGCKGISDVTAGAYDVTGDRYQVASDLIHGLSLPDSQVTEVILAQVITQVKQGWTAAQDQSALLALCPDPVLLGNRLLQTAQDLDSFPEAEGFGEECQVRLLVVAHSAFSSRLSLQGISGVMTRVRELIKRLATNAHFRLIVQLLLGIARYDEMSYAFELLLRHHRLELLLTAGVKDERLGAVLRIHLIRHHPEDVSHLRLVSSRFGHHSESAADWRRRADAAVSALVTSSEGGGACLPGTGTARAGLAEAIQAYRHAAAFYKHAEMPAAACSCLAHAQLAALQLSISSGALSLAGGAGPALLLARNQQQISHLLVHVLPYGAARLVLAAYPGCTVDWAAVVYRQYLCLGRDQYLEEYLAVEKCIGRSVMEGLLRRIASSGRNFSIDRLRTLTLSAETLDLQYRAASELRLRDLVQSLLERPEAAWLKDTVYKTGGVRGT